MKHFIDSGFPSLNTVGTHWNNQKARKSFVVMQHYHHAFWVSSNIFLTHTTIYEGGISMSLRL